MKITNPIQRRSAVVLILLCAVLTIAVSGQTFTSLTDLNGSDGAFPEQNGLVQGTDGNFYGTAARGGAFGQGTVYKVTPGGTLSALYTFCSLAQCADGAQPFSPVILGSDGNFYGSTGGGGAHNSGTFFKLTPTGTLTTLYSFCAQANCRDGDDPSGSLVLGFDGNFYGTTSGNEGDIAGTIFKITPTGTLTTLYNFCSRLNCADGLYPRAGLVQARDGSFYGTTQVGGTTIKGTLFRYTPTGQFKTLYAFCSLANCADGSTPFGSLTVTYNGKIYGTTASGGNGFNEGTAFELTPAGTLTTLYNFCSATNCVDGANPWSGLIEATDGRFYGSTDVGGFKGRGIAFRMTAAGAITRLHSFHATDGAYPQSALTQGTDGDIYGTTTNGGPTNRTVCGQGGPPFGCGTGFRLSLGIKPFVKTVQPGGRAGDSVIILGNNLIGSTSVTFNGTAATFSVVSDTEITAAVPAGATGGSIKVVTPSGTLTSNIAYRVLP